MKTYSHFCSPCRPCIASILLCCLLAVTAHGQGQAGRNLSGRTTFGISAAAGSIFGLEGEVQETSRPIDRIGGPTSGSPPENYSWSELGFDESLATYGFNLEKMWTYVTLQGRFMMANPTVSHVADRNYYIGVGSVNFNGQEYEYLLIPEGTSYEGDINLYQMDLRLQVTPFSLGTPQTSMFTPWFHLGFNGFMADYDIEAGQSIRVTQYENPPRDYVVGGRATGTTGLIVPEIGFGAEVMFALSQQTRLYLQGHAALLKFDGSNSDFGVSSRNEKAIDLDYHSFGARLLLEQEIHAHADLIVGVEFQHMSGTATVEAEDKDEATILALREKFDKEALFELSSVTAFIGLRF
jgi:hypothetical protein